jgi:fucose permease
VYVRSENKHLNYTIMKMKHVLNGIAAVFAMALVVALMPTNNEVEQANAEQTTIKNEKKTEVLAARKGRLRPRNGESQAG